MSLAPWLLALLHAHALAFARLGAALMLLPGLGDARLPPRVRLLLALALSALVAPALGGRLPPPPAAPAAFVAQLLAELTIGLALGAVTALLLAILQQAGTMIATVMGMANAYGGELFGNELGSSIGAVLTAGGVTLLFVAGLDRLLLQALVTSYEALPAGAWPDPADLAHNGTAAVAASFSAAVQLALPFLLLGLVLNLGLGLANRAVPALQVLALGLPLSLAGGLMLLALALAGILAGFASLVPRLVADLLP